MMLSNGTNLKRNTTTANLNYKSSMKLQTNMKLYSNITTRSLKLIRSKNLKSITWTTKLVDEKSMNVEKSMTLKSTPKRHRIRISKAAWDLKNNKKLKHTMTTTNLKFKRSIRLKTSTKLKQQHAFKQQHEIKEQQNTKTTRIRDSGIMFWIVGFDLQSLVLVS